jgi:ribosome maturation factor RimP
MIDKYELQEKLKSIIGDNLKKEGVILVDLNFMLSGKKSILRILVDLPGGGITLDKCTYINNLISQLLDEENLIQSSYVLEVSSPGVDRPLISKEDFFRCLNRKVKIFFNQFQEGKSEITGVIVSVADAGVNVDSEGQIQQIPFDRIRKAKQIIEELK